MKRRPILPIRATAYFGLKPAHAVSPLDAIAVGASVAALRAIATS